MTASHRPAQTYPVSTLPPARTARAQWAARWLRRGIGAIFAIGAVANTVLLIVTPTSYAPFADQAISTFVADTWRQLVAPNPVPYLGLLIVFEAVVGIALLMGVRNWEVAAYAAGAFTVALVLFGWGFLYWSVPMLAVIIATLLLDRAGSGEPEAEPEP